tara:strand:+ start:1164 stop:1751 length:588 start_codon:yes stop_codon:yes gene_type:complete
MKRSRGRGRRQGNSSNRNYESNGPNLKVRGNAQSIYEKYQSLAHDALSSGELITAENYLQHAEHYYRIVQANQPVRQEEDASSENGQQPTTQDTDTVEQLVLGAGEEGADTEAIAKANGAENGTNNGDAREEKQSRRRGPLRRRRRDDNGSNGTSEDAGNGEVTASVETSSEVDAIAPTATAPASESADDEAASA